MENGRSTLAFVGEKKQKKYFEGWYLKLQGVQETIALIPAYHINRSGHRTASIQVVTEKEGYFVQYDILDFTAKTHEFSCRIGNNIFCMQGIILHIEQENLSIHGKVKFGTLHPLERDIMGPFRHIPFLQCNHGILSMKHTLHGQLRVNGRSVTMDGGTGYLEKDWGSSFPSFYRWTQCCFYSQKESSIVLAVADIPVGIAKFRGCICAVSYGGQEFMLTTWKGAKSKCEGKNTIFLEQGAYTLEVRLLKEQPISLKAPGKGKMSREICESLSCTVQYIFRIGGKKLFDIVSDRASYEYSEFN